VKAATGAPAGPTGGDVEELVPPHAASARQPRAVATTRAQFA
jgi:hypothetical protein